MKAKSASLFAQIIGAVWIGVWCSVLFIQGKGTAQDIILSGGAIMACFSPVYFNLILDKLTGRKNERNTECHGQ